MTIKERIRGISGKALVVLGVFFGLGFTIGFLTGFGYSSATRPPTPAGSRQNADEIKGALSSDGRPAVGHAAPPPAAPKSNISADEDGEGSTNNVSVADGEFALLEHGLNDDENGVYISGTVLNRSQNAFDAAQIVFELRDARGRTYTTVSDRTTERMDPGDSWGFIIYIPYTDLRPLDSYRLQGIMGVRK